MLLSILSYIPRPSVCPPWRSICSGPFFNWVVCLPGVESCEFFIYFGHQTIVRGIIGKYVFPYSWFSLHFNAVSFRRTEAFYFDEVPFVFLSFMSLALGDILVKILVHGISEIFLPMFSSRTSMVSWLIFKSFIHLEFIFIYDVSWWSSFTFFM